MIFYLLTNIIFSIQNNINSHSKRISDIETKADFHYNDQNFTSKFIHSNGGVSIINCVFNSFICQTPSIIKFSLVTGQILSTNLTNHLIISSYTDGALIRLYSSSINFTDCFLSDSETYITTNISTYFLGQVYLEESEGNFTNCIFKHHSCYVNATQGSNTILGGLFHLSSSNGTFLRCEFSHTNLALTNITDPQSLFVYQGGQFYMLHSNADFDECSFDHFTVTTIENYQFRLLGSSFYASNSNIVLNSCSFSDTFIDSHSAGINLIGGEIYLSNGKAVFNGCSFSPIKMQLTGSLYQVEGICLYITDNSNTNLTDCVLNTKDTVVSNYGNAMQIQMSVCNITRSTFNIGYDSNNNDTIQYGSLAYSINSILSYENCCINVYNVPFGSDVIYSSTFQAFILFRELSESIYTTSIIPKISITGCTINVNVVQCLSNFLFFYHEILKNSTFLEKFEDNKVFISPSTNVYMFSGGFFNANYTTCWEISNNGIYPYNSSYYKLSNYPILNKDTLEEITFEEAFNIKLILPTHQFSQSNYFTISNFFRPTIVFSNSEDFTKSVSFSESSEFTRSDDFSNTLSFTKSTVFSESHAFSKSNDFDKTNEFTNSKVFTRSEAFSNTFDFTKSTVFSESHAFTKSNDFDKTDEFTISDEFTFSEAFTKSNDFTNSDDFIKSNVFTGSKDFTKSSDFSKSDFFSNSQTLIRIISPTSEFTNSSYFSNSHTLEIILSPTDQFSSSSEFTKSDTFTSSDYFTPTPTQSIKDNKISRSATFLITYLSIKSVSFTISFDSLKNSYTVLPYIIHYLSPSYFQTFYSFEINQKKVISQEKLIGIVCGSVAVFFLILSIIVFAIKRKRRTQKFIESSISDLSDNLNSTNQVEENIDFEKFDDWL